MISRLKSLFAVNPEPKPTQIISTPTIQKPAYPRKANSNIGNAPRTKIGNKGTSSNISDGFRIGHQSEPVKARDLSPGFYGEARRKNRIEGDVSPPSRSGSRHATRR